MSFASSEDMLCWVTRAMANFWFISSFSPFYFFAAEDVMASGLGSLVLVSGSRLPRCSEYLHFLAANQTS